MKSLLIILIGVVGAIFAGCAAPFFAPTDVSHIKLASVDSPVVIVGKIHLVRKQGTLVATGYVLKRLGAFDTTQTHLDVTLYDSSGMVLRRTVEHFEPREIPRRIRRPHHAVYRVRLDILPPKTARLEVKAHEGSHDTTGSSRRDCNPAIASHLTSHVTAMVIAASSAPRPFSYVASRPLINYV